MPFFQPTNSVKAPKETQNIFHYTTITVTSPRQEPMGNDDWLSCCSYITWQHNSNGLPVPKHFCVTNSIYQHYNTWLRMVLIEAFQRQ